MRQITLGAELARAGFRVILSCHEIPTSLIERGRKFGLEYLHRDEPQSSSSAEYAYPSLTPGVLVFDGYQFPGEAIERSRTTDRRVIVVDDNGEHSRLACDMILNQNLHATEEMYRNNDSSPMLLLGTRWALIRPEVTDLAKTDATTHREGIFVSVGGLDTRGLVPRIRDTALTRRDWTVHAAGGVGQRSGASPSEVAEYMTMSRVGIIAFGTTTWEALCLGMPVVGLVVADNQLLVAESIRAAGLGESFDCRLSCDLDSIVDVAERLHDDTGELRHRAKIGRSLVDGGGASRTTARILELVN